MLRHLTIILVIPQLVSRNRIVRLFEVNKRTPLHLLNCIFEVPQYREPQWVCTRTLLFKQDIMAYNTKQTTGCLKRIRIWRGCCFVFRRVNATFKQNERKVAGRMNKAQEICATSAPTEEYAMQDDEVGNCQSQNIYAALFNMPYYTPYPF